MCQLIIFKACFAHFLPYLPHKEVNMARNNKSYHKDLKQQIYEKFTTMLKNGEGRSKTADKKNNCTQNFIYSYNTYKSYWKHAKYFANYINEYHPECTTLKAAKKYINEWLQFRVYELVLYAWSTERTTYSRSKISINTVETTLRPVFQGKKKLQTLVNKGLKQFH